jgi:hypothetical protein
MAISSQRGGLMSYGVSRSKRTCEKWANVVNDPFRHLVGIARCSGEGSFGPYQSAHLSRYDALS